MKQLDTYLAETTVDGDRVVVCRRCEEVLCSSGENYNRHALSDRKSLAEAGPLVNDPAEFVDDEMEFRQYYCPGCGTLLKNEVILAELDPVHDKELR